ncbi:M14 family zinc carboxypeptidase [Polaromonas sp. DSR2-3-2]|uniref:M14 family metallopeptidase n=1 Tax=unclassified Polaromonas TaxID=2638319 RepID=UPI003CF477B7
MTAPLIFLVACTSVQLPPWVPELQRPAAPASAAPASVPVEPAVVVQTSPVAPPSVFPAVPVEAPPPYGPAVAARFTAPTMVYSTPGLQGGRTSFTTQPEIHAWLRDLATALSRSAGVKAALLPIGSSQQGQPLEALVLTRGTGTDPASLLATGRPTVLLIGQQHGDAPAASEALLVIARELAQGLLQPLLERINVVIVPRVNPDGATQGEALAAGGQDLARDHLRLSTPETQALARLSRDYQPTVVVDAGEYRVSDIYQQKFGAVQKFDALLQYATTANLPEFLTKADEEWYRRPLLAALKGQGLSTDWYHSTSADTADRTVFMARPEPVTSRNVEGLKNAVSMTIDSRGTGLGRLHLQRRVHTHVTAITSVLGSTAQRTRELSQLRPYLDKEVASLACRGQAAVEVANTPAQYDLQMLDPMTGADKTVTVDWESALALRTLKSRVRPCGYWLSGSSKTAVERLRLHGVKVLEVLEPSALLGDIYRESQRPSSTQQSGPGATANSPPAARSEVSLVRGVIDAPVGSYYVPLSQPLANLVIAALEPDTQSSYFANQLVSDLAGIARVMSVPSLKSEELP